MLFKLLIIIGLVVAYLGITAGMASFMVWLGEEDNDAFPLYAWLSGLLVFLTVVFYIMKKL